MKLIRTLSVILALLLLFAGCGGTGQDESSEPLSENVSSYDDSPVTSTMLQGNPSGVWFMISTAISESLNTIYPGSVLNITPGNITSNISRICAGEAEFALSQGHAAVVENNKISAGEESPEVYGIAAFYPSQVQMVVSAKKEVTSFREIIDEKIPLKISIGAVGNVHEEIFNQLLALYGTTLQDMESWGFEVVHKTSEEGKEMLADGTIDGYFFMMGAPTPAIVENATNLDLTMIEFDDSIIDQMCEQNGYFPSTMAADTYNFLEEDYKTFSDYTILAATENVSDATAYKMARAIYENIEYISTVHATLKDLNGQTMIEKLRVSIHPGALQYYKEVGLVE